MKMHMENAYHDEVVHRNVQKTISDGMGNGDAYTREGNNMLRKNDSGTEYTVRLHFSENTDSDKLIEEVQKILAETFVRELVFRGGK